MLIYFSKQCVIFNIQDNFLLLMGHFLTEVKCGEKEKPVLKYNPLGLDPESSETHI